MNTTMSFPTGSPVRLAPGLETAQFFIDPVTLLISEISAGATLPRHAHDDVQMGLCLAGSFIMNLDDRAIPLHPYDRVYCLASGEPHAAQNPANRPAVGLDLKLPARHDVTATVDLLPLTPRPKDEATDLAVGPWFEVTRFTLPTHEHRFVSAKTALTIGLVTSGRFSVTVADETRDRARYEVFVPDPATGAKVTCIEPGTFIIVSIQPDP